MNNTVVVAGGGTAGLLLAYELGLAGVDTAVLEAAPAPRQDTPSAAINPTSAELLEQRGLMDALREDSMALPAAHFAMLWLDTAGLDGRFNIVVNQARLNDVLRERAAALGVRMLFEHRVAGLRQDEDGVTVIACSADGTEHEIRCAYLAGCDGENSAVRKLAGIEFPGHDPRFYGIVGDIRVELSELPEGYVGAFRYPNGGLFMGAPLGPDLLRIVTAEYNADPPDADTPVSLEEALAHIRKLTGVPLRNQGAEWLARYRNATRNAERYRCGRVFLVGDAAHIFFPLGGQRLNTCMQDAVNLGWKLAAHINGWAPEGLLDSYQAERYPVDARACRVTAAQSALIASDDGIEELREVFTELIRFGDVNRYLLEVATGLDVRYPIEYPGLDLDGDAAVRALLGRRLGPVKITTRDGETNALVPLHSGHGVLFDLSGGTQDVARAEDWADRVDVVIAEPTDVVDATAVLVRPDGHVAWADSTGKDAEGLEAALRTWFGADKKSGKAGPN